MHHSADQQRHHFCPAWQAGSTTALLANLVPCCSGVGLFKGSDANACTAAADDKCLLSALCNKASWPGSRLARLRMEVWGWSGGGRQPLLVSSSCHLMAAAKDRSSDVTCCTETLWRPMAGVSKRFVIQCIVLLGQDTKCCGVGAGRPMDKSL